MIIDLKNTEREGKNINVQSLFYRSHEASRRTQTLGRTQKPRVTKTEANTTEVKEHHCNIYVNIYSFHCVFNKIPYCLL